jgi:hypothetical protein
MDGHDIQSLQSAKPISTFSIGLQPRRWMKVRQLALASSPSFTCATEEVNLKQNMP